MLSQFPSTSRRMEYRMASQEKLITFRNLYVLVAIAASQSPVADQTLPMLHSREHAKPVTCRAFPPTPRWRYVAVKATNIVALGHLIGSPTRSMN